MASLTVTLARIVGKQVAERMEITIRSEARYFFAAVKMVKIPVRSN